VSGLEVDIEKVYPGGARVSAAFGMPAGEPSVTVLFGPSGAGKTTILRCVAGLERPSSGRISFGDETWSDIGSGVELPPQARSVGYVFQDYALFPRFTVWDNVGYGLTGVGREERSRLIGDALRMLEIESLGPRRPGELSGGQQQRAALARALARRPRLLLLDEPLSALDAPLRRRLRDELRGLLLGLQVPALLVTHDWTEALALGDELVLMLNGRSVQRGAPLEVFSRPGDVEAAFALGVDTIALGQVEESTRGLVTLRIGGGTIRVADPGVAAERFYACIRAEDVTLEIGPSPGSTARNHLPARIVEVHPAGATLRVVLDAGFRLVAAVTRQSAEDLALAPGSCVTAVFKASSVHLIPH
jgi:molybdate transport system ATP-binding protein